MTSSLTDRYLAAVLRSVPARRREEIATELRASIADMIEARTDNGQDPVTAEREVLTELGDPTQLAARYADRRLHLIGPAYYLVWQRVLWRMLAFVPALAAVVVGLIETVDGNAGGAVGKAVVAAVWAAMQTAFWVTLVFAVLERLSPTLDLPRWTVDHLPAERLDRRIPLTDTGAAIGWLVLLIAYLPWQHFRSYVPDGSGGDVPILNPDRWTFWLPYLIAVLVCHIGLEIVAYRVGRWTAPLVATKVVLHTAFAAPVVWLLLTDQLINPALAQHIAWLGRDDNLTTVTTVAAVVTLVVTLWDAADSAVKAYRHRG